MTGCYKGESISRKQVTIFSLTTIKKQRTTLWWL